MPRIEKSGYKRFWELKQFVGKDGEGKKHGIEGFRDMLTGEFHAPPDGWNGEPPPLPSGERVPETNTEKFRANYRQTFGHD
jgi:hypothetical protein